MITVDQLPINMQTKIVLKPCPVSGLPGKCWVWMRAVTSRGYGSVGYQGRTWSTHKLAYTLLIDSVPKGLQLDHLCRIIVCCNPLHLEPVTGTVNGERAATHRWLSNPRCPQGHPLIEPNIITKSRPNGRVIRNCRMCALNFMRRYRMERNSQKRNYISVDKRHAAILAAAEAALATYFQLEDTG